MRVTVTREMGSSNNDGPTIASVPEVKGMNGRRRRWKTTTIFCLNIFSQKFYDTHTHRNEQGGR